MCDKRRGGQAVDIAEEGATRAASVGLACAVLAIFAIVIMYWLWLPSIILGAVGVALGIKGRKSAGAGASGRELAAAAIALGIAAILLTPGVNMIAEGEADYGRKCALNPDREHC
jgi:hypothetical protein